MKDSKYIIVDLHGIEIVLMFDPVLSHSDFARPYRGHVVSAGFFEVYQENGDVCVAAFGDSETLRIKSRPGDGAILKQRLTNTITESGIQARLQFLENRRR